MKALKITYFSFPFLLFLASILLMSGACDMAFLGHINPKFTFQTIVYTKLLGVIVGVLSIIIFLIPKTVKYFSRKIKEVCFLLKFISANGLPDSHARLDYECWGGNYRIWEIKKGNNHFFYHHRKHSNGHKIEHIWSCSPLIRIDFRFENEKYKTFEVFCTKSFLSHSLAVCILSITKKRTANKILKKWQEKVL